MRLEKKIGTLILALLVACAVAYGQQKDPRVNPPVQPLPPLTTGESSTTTETSPEPAAAPAKPEQRPVSEIEQLGLGLKGGRSVLTSRLHVAFQGDTNASASAGASILRSSSTLGGNVELMRDWGRSSLSLNYAGDGTLYNSRAGLNRQSHSLGLRYNLAGRSWSLTLRDSVGFLPESAFGFNTQAGGSLLPGVPSTVQSQLNPLLVPNQSILNGFGQRISNTFAGEVGYVLSRRSNLSVSSSYGILRGLGSGLVGNDRWSLGLGYNYQLTGRDSLSMSYSHSGSSFKGSDFSIQGDTASVGYTRQLSGRLALQVNGGPYVSRFQNPVAGDRTRLSFSMGSSLSYQLADASLQLSYTRGITGGSGVLLGAHTDQFDGGISKRLSRMWNGALGLGYARNVSLVQSTGLTNQINFNTWHGRVDVSRPVGRYARMGLSYGVTGQASNSSFCQGAACGQSSIRHRFGLSFDFSFRPIALD